MHCERNPEFSKRDSVDLSQPLQCQKDGVRIRISHGDRLTVLRPLAPPESQANEIQCKLSPGSSPQAGDFRCLDQPRVHAGATRVTDPSVGRQALPATATLPKRSSLREEVIVHDRRASSGTKPRVPSLPITGKAFAHGERAVSIGMNMMSREARKYCHYPSRLPRAASPPRSGTCGSEARRAARCTNAACAAARDRTGVAGPRIQNDCRYTTAAMPPAGLEPAADGRRPSMFAVTPWRRVAPPRVAWGPDPCKGPVLLLDDGARIRLARETPDARRGGAAIPPRLSPGNEARKRRRQSGPARIRTPITRLQGVGAAVAPRARHVRRRS